MRLDDPMIGPAASSLLHFSRLYQISSLSSWALRTSRNKSRESRSRIVPEQTASLLQQGSIERRPRKSPIHRSSVFAETAGSRVLDALACRTRSRGRRTKRERERERKRDSEVISQLLETPPHDNRDNRAAVIGRDRCGPVTRSSRESRRVAVRVRGRVRDRTRARDLFSFLFISPGRRRCERLIHTR